MNLAQLLGRQARTEVPVPLADHRQHLAPKRLGLASVTRAATPLRNQASSALGPVRLQQPEYLTPLEPQQLRCRLGRQPPLIQISQHLEPPQLPIAHQPNRHP